MSSTDPVYAKLVELGFNAPQIVEGQASIADLFGKRRCGVYVLHFANGEHYVGKSVDVVKRYVQHRNNHQDIHSLSFKRVARKVVVAEEKAVTHNLEVLGARLRNIENVTRTYAISTSFDEVMPPELQEQWLTDLDFNYAGGNRTPNDVIRQKHLKKYHSMMNLPYVEEILAIAREYVQTSIPAYRISEGTFWLSTCLPSKTKNPSIYVRINVGWQLAFDAGLFDDQPLFRWFISQSLAEEAFNISLNQLDVEPSIQIEYTSNDDPSDVLCFFGKSGLVKGSPDQVVVGTSRIDIAQDFLRDPYLLEAVRIFNLGLVQKGRCPWRNIHCYALADHFLD